MGRVDDAHEFAPRHCSGGLACARDTNTSDPRDARALLAIALKVCVIGFFVCFVSHCCVIVLGNVCDDGATKLNESVGNKIG